MGKNMNADNPPTMDGIEIFGYIVKSFFLFGISVVIYILLKDEVSFLGKSKEIEIEYIGMIFIVLAIPTFIYAYCSAASEMAQKAKGRKLD